MRKGVSGMKVFVDGGAGTTGLRIRERLAARQELEMITLPEEKRKDPAAVKEAINASDVCFLCLPDDAAREAAAMAENPKTVILDTSTAHRTAPGWVYGFPELSEESFGRIRESRRIAVPGCHASGFIALTAPLVRAGVISPEAELTCFSLTGYSGGGKKMIAEYEGQERSPLLDAPRMYGLTQRHKHLPEMTAVTGLKKAPVFCPIVGDYYAGMEVTVSVRGDREGKVRDEIRAVYEALYRGPVVRYTAEPGEDGFLSAGALAGTDRMEISVLGNEEQILLTARFDNLGKGASGAAIECMNIAMGWAPETGLVL